MTYVSRTGPSIQNLGNFSTAAELSSTRPATLYNPGTTAYTTDQGFMVGNGATWTAVGVGGSGPPGSSGVAQNSVATYALARLAVGTATGDTLYIFGRTSQSDGGQGLFTWVQGGSTTINDGTQLSATGGIWQRTPDQPVTPFMFGAKGDSNGNAGNGTDDTTAVQAAVNTKYCVLPANYYFKVSSPIVMPTRGTLVGQHAATSGLVGNAVVGSIVQIGDGVATNNNNITLRNFRILGSGTYALRVSIGTNLTIDSVFANGPSQGETFSNPNFTIAAYWFDYTFDDSLTNLHTGGSTVGGTATFTGSVGGATSGTLTAALPNGKQPFIFSNGDHRVVTITGGTAATWTNAVTAGTVTTAKYGMCYFVGGAFNANYCSQWNTESNSTAFNFYMDDILGSGGTNGNVFDSLTAQGALVGLFVGNQGDCVFNSLYVETIGQSVILGSQVSGSTAYCIVFNSPLLVSAGGGNNNACVRLDRCRSIVFNTPDITAYNYIALAPVTITRGGGDTTGGGAYGLCLVTPAGVVKSVILTRPGFGYTTTPTVSIGGGGTGATATATFGNVCTFTGTTSGAVLTVTAVASGSLQIGQTLTGGGVTAGTYISGLGTGIGGVGTYFISVSQSVTPTGCSAITALTRTAGGSGYGNGYALVSVGSAIKCTFVAPRVRYTTDEDPLWPMVVSSSTDAGSGSAGITVLDDMDKSYGDQQTPVAVSMKKSYSNDASTIIQSIAYDFGGGAIVYTKYTLPSYP